jgi:hypothetical protein
MLSMKGERATAVVAQLYLSAMLLDELASAPCIYWLATDHAGYMYAFTLLNLSNTAHPWRNCSRPPINGTLTQPSRPTTTSNTANHQNVVAALRAASLPLVYSLGPPLTLHVVVNNSP